MAESGTVRAFHAHVYYAAETRQAARALCEAARDRFAVTMGRMHERPVGPHPAWSCQLAFAPETFGDLVPWLALNRRGLTVFIHPETGDAVADHTDHAMWMGEILELNIDVLRKVDEAR